jgi:hypothetical protein
VSVELSVDGGRTSFRPGETVSGVVGWDLPETPASLELRVFWRTEGKGRQDLEVVRTERVPAGGPRGERRFSLPLPSFPYSFSGRLVSILWGLEAVLQPGGESSGLILVISPTGRPIAPM